MIDTELTPEEQARRRAEGNLAKLQWANFRRDAAIAGAVLAILALALAWLL